MQIEPRAKKSRGCSVELGADAGSLQSRQNRQSLIALPTMSKARKSSANFGGSADETEAIFYEAMQAGDIERLMSCWADEDEVVCIHPGGPRLVGLGAVRSAFESVFSNGNVRVRIEALRKIESMTSAVHSVRERIEILTNEGPVEAFAIATNVYHKTAQGWRLVAHHVSPGSLQEAPDSTEVPHVLH